MYQSIVVGTDGSSTAKAAVDQAKQLGKAFGAHVHLVSAYRSPVAALGGAPEVVMANPTLEAEIRESVEASLDHAAAELKAAGVAVTTYACPQSAARAILDVAEHQKADLIVVGSRGMTGARRVLGSVPNNVAHHAECNVLIVHTC